MKKCSEMNDWHAVNEVNTARMHGGHFLGCTVPGSEVPGLCLYPFRTLLSPFTPPSGSRYAG